MHDPVCCNNILWRMLHAGSSEYIFWINECQFMSFVSFRLLSLFLWRKTFLSFCHFVAMWLKERKRSESYLSRWIAQSKSKNYPWCVCVGGEGQLGVIPSARGNWEGICESFPYLRALCRYPKLFPFPLTIRHQDINLSTWAIDLDSLLKVVHYGYYNRWSVFPNVS